jgi:hypothetical protein
VQFDLMGEEQVAPILRLEIEIARPLRGRDVGRLLERVPAAFEQFQRAERGPSDAATELRIRHIRTGSLVIDFTLVAAATAIVAVDDCRKVLVGFVVRLGRAFRIMAGFEDGTVTAIERRVGEAAAAPIVLGDVSSITINVYGDNLNFTEMNLEMAHAIIQRARVAADKPAEISAKASPKPTPQTAGASVEFGRVESYGLLVKRADRWFAILPGTAQVVPMMNSETMRTAQVGEYLAEGVVLMSRGVPIGFEVNSRAFAKVSYLQREFFLSDAPPKQHKRGVVPPISWVKTWPNEKMVRVRLLALGGENMFLSIPREVLRDVFGDDDLSLPVPLNRQRAIEQALQRGWDHKRVTRCRRKAALSDEREFQLNISDFR